MGTVVDLCQISEGDEESERTKLQESIQWLIPEVTGGLNELILRRWNSCAELVCFIRSVAPFGMSAWPSRSVRQLVLNFKCGLMLIRS